MQPRNWKVIGVDNFGRESVSDYLVLAGLSEDAAKKIADIINDDDPAPGSASRFYKATPTDQPLYKFEP